MNVSTNKDCLLFLLLPYSSQIRSSAINSARSAIRRSLPIYPSPFYCFYFTATVITSNLPESNLQPSVLPPLE